MKTWILKRARMAHLKWQDFFFPIRTEGPESSKNHGHDEILSRSAWDNLPRNVDGWQSFRWLGRNDLPVAESSKNFRAQAKICDIVPITFCSSLPNTFFLRGAALELAIKPRRFQLNRLVYRKYSAVLVVAFSKKSRDHTTSLGRREPDLPPNPISETRLKK